MTEAFIRNVLFPVIRSGMGLEGIQVSVSREDFRLLHQFGRAQSILPVIWEGLQKQSIPSEWLEELQNDRDKCLYRYMMRDYSLQRIREVFEAEGILYVPLKGAVLCRLYPESWMRTSSDLDILVREEDLPRAVEALKAKAGFRMEKRNYHDVTMLSSEICLELHFHIKENTPNLDRVLSRVWDHVRPAASGWEYEMTPEFLVFHIVAHMAYHMINDGLGIRPYLDLWLLKQKTAYDDAVLREMCAEGGILQFYDISCELVKVWMEGAPHTDSTALLEQYCLSGGVFGSQAFGAYQREHRGLDYLSHRLIASREVLEEMYPGLRKRPYLLPYYQLKRWTRLLDPGTRKAVVSEVKSLRTVDRETISAYDSLLKSLGL